MAASNFTICDETPSERLARWLVQRRKLVLSLALLLLIITCWRTLATYAALRSDLEELLPESAPSVVAGKAVRERIPSMRHLGIVIDTGGAKNIEAAERFAADLKSRIARYPSELVGGVRTGTAGERQFIVTYALQLMDPADVKRLADAVEERRDWEVSRAGGMNLLDESEDPPPRVPIEELSEKYRRLHGVPAHAHDRFVSADLETVVLLVQGSFQGMTEDRERSLLSRVASDAHNLGFPDAYAPGMRFGFAGDIATRVQETEGLKNDLGLSGVLVSLLVVLAVLMYFRSWLALPILGIPLLVGTTATFALVALPPLSIRHLNSNTAFLGSIVVGNGINSGIILLARFKEERERGTVPDHAIAAALRATWRPTLAAALAASAAYGSLIFTDFRGFNQFGWIGALGMVTCWACAMLMIPPLCHWLGAGMTARSPARDRATSSFSLGLLARPRSLLFAMLVLGVVASIGIVRRQGDFFEYDFSKLRRSDSWASGERYWGKRMDATLQRYLTPTLVLAHDAAQARQVEQRVRRLRDENRAGGLIATVRSAEDVLPGSRFAAIEQARRLKDSLSPRLLATLSPRERAAIDRALADTSLVPLREDQIPETLLLGLREHDGRIDRSVLVYPKLTTGTWDARRIDEYTSDLRQAAQAASPVLAAGPLLLSSDIVSAIETDGPRATMIASVALVIVCALSFRSFGLSASALFSIFAGVVLTVGTMAWSGERLNFSNFVVLPITLGIAADYSINMLKRYQTEGTRNLGPALTATGGAVTLCSITTIIGYGSLLVAQNRALFSFGIFAVAGEVACLVTAILALPAGLFLAESLKKRSDKSPRGIGARHATR